MKIYHTETQEDYDALMVELEKNGYPKLETSYKTALAISCEELCVMSKKEKTTYSNRKYFEREFPDIPIQKYQANDSVNSPNHYTQGELEVIDILEDKLTPDEFMGFLKGNVTKYNFRETHKNQDEDIAKAEWYQLKLKEFVAKGKSIYSRVAKKFTKLTGYEFDNEFISKLESGELMIVEGNKED